MSLICVRFTLPSRGTFTAFQVCEWLSLRYLVMVVSINFTNGLWAHNSNDVNIRYATMLLLLIQRNHKLEACVKCWPEVSISFNRRVISPFSAFILSAHLVKPGISSDCKCTSAYKSNFIVIYIYIYIYIKHVIKTYCLVWTSTICTCWQTLVSRPICHIPSYTLAF